MSKSKRFTHDWLTKGQGGTVWAVFDEEDGTHICTLDTSEYPQAEEMCKGIATKLNSLKIKPKGE